MGYFCVFYVLKAGKTTSYKRLRRRNVFTDFLLNPTTMVQKTYYKTKDYCKVKFSFAIENAETVEILGLNSDWQNSVIMSRKKDGSFTADVNLPKDSQHEFKYRVNETLWHNDPDADSQAPNSFGGTNSVISL